MANLSATLTGQPLQTYDPQGDYLKLISTGDRNAVAEKWGLSLRAPVLWRWKNAIDRKFMARFDPAAMTARAQGQSLLAAVQQVPGLALAMGTRPMCGGCGAKLGAGALQGALAALPAVTREDVLAGAGDDAAVLVHGPGVQVITTDHLRGLTEDATLMGQIAATHAMGDIWAMGAKAQVALSQIILPRMSEEKAAQTLAEITHAAAAVFAAEGAAIVGGHSSFGAEMTVGFTVTGLAGAWVAKTGAQPGDALILTKALGVGTVLAAEMTGARVPGLITGEALATCLAAMVQPMGRASAILAPVAHAMTDVTGFGLAGHLCEMLGEDRSVTLDAASIPVLPGALALAAAGVESSLAVANRAGVLGRLVAAPGPMASLMIDPQTCGGLLAAVPFAAAEALVAALRAEGFDAAAIGRVGPGPLRVTLR